MRANEHCGVIKAGLIERHREGPNSAWGVRGHIEECSR